MPTATINAGELTKRVALQEFVTTGTDTRGQKTGTWTTYKSVWAAIETLDGRELEHARKIYADASLRVKIRYQSAATLNVKHRILFGTRVFNIGHTNNVDEIGESWILLCSEDKA